MAARLRAPGWYRAQRDPEVGQAVRLLQESPAEAWTIGALASQTRVSRATLARRFAEVVGQPPMEFPMQMVNRGGQPSEQSADARDRAERVGNESVTTPAGTFTCEHWRLKDRSGDVWISDKVAPWGLVKMTGRESNMTLVRIITGAKTHITGTPQNFDPMEMMRQRKNQ